MWDNDQYHFFILEKKNRSHRWFQPIYDNSIMKITDRFRIIATISISINETKKRAKMCEKYKVLPQSPTDLFLILEWCSNCCQSTIDFFLCVSLKIKKYMLTKSLATTHCCLCYFIIYSFVVLQINYSFKNWNAFLCAIMK